MKGAGRDAFELYLSHLCRAHTLSKCRCADGQISFNGKPPPKAHC